ncbi:MAG: DNA repair protein RadC [Gemmatimonadetes bacterium]|jgi:DNA repair protein RadC|nr:DNA repair protein RadC [Gemmatimonadota bacterium]
MSTTLNGFEILPTVIAEQATRRSPLPGVAAGEMPRERLARHGTEALKDQELLAILLGTGYRGQNVLELAHAILDVHPKEALMEMDLKQLSRLKGVGKAKGCLLIAAFELGRRALQKGLGARPVISTPGDTVPLLADIRDQRREFFLCMYLNARNQLIHKEVISIGSLSASIVHPREVFQVGVANSAASIILAHNHPSGDVSPSKDDVELTRRLVKAGEIMGIEILDHIIISTLDFLSLKERGLM